MYLFRVKMRSLAARSRETSRFATHTCRETEKGEFSATGAPTDPYRRDVPIGGLGVKRGDCPAAHRAFDTAILCVPALFFPGATVRHARAIAAIVFSIFGSAVAKSLFI